MDCKYFEKFLEENPKIKEINNEILTHLEGCRRCKTLFDIHITLINKEEPPSFSLLQTQKVMLLKEAKKVYLQRESTIFDKLFIPFVTASFITGIFLNIKTFLELEIIKQLKPYLSYLKTPIIEPFLNLSQTPLLIFALFTFSFSLSFILYQTNRFRTI